MIMPEGDRDFTMWLRQIEEISAHVGVPVIVKEVGFGMSRETIGQLIDVGVHTIDVSGKGGTNFAAIENARRTAITYDDLENWGQSTVISLLEASSHRGKAEFLASGGIKTPLDIVKALSLGAKAAGLSGQFLHMVLSEGPEKTAETIEAWKQQITTVMAMLGKTSVADLARTDLIFQRDILDWCDMRGIDYRHYANRSVQS
jgi:isopentenyl-diphosphate delta-isomerase